MISVGHKEGTVEEHEARLLHRVFEFGDRPVYEVMIPRPEVVWLEAGTTTADFYRIFNETPHARFPVYRDSFDSVVGVVNMKDVLRAVAQGQASPDAPIDSLVRPAYFVPETMQVSQLLKLGRNVNENLRH